MDGATPSGASLIAEALLTAAHMVDGDWAGRYGEAAADTLLAHSPLLATRAALGRSLAGGGRGGGARAAAGGRRQHRTRIPTADCRAAHGAGRDDRRRGAGGLLAAAGPAATGSAARTPPTCAEAGCAICR